MVELHGGRLPEIVRTPSCRPARATLSERDHDDHADRTDYADFADHADYADYADYADHADRTDRADLGRAAALTSPLPDKPALLAALASRLEEDLATVERRQADTQAGATHAENRAEHAKDTRATEDSYLARGLAERVTELRRNLEALANMPVRAFAPDEAIAVGALVTVVTETEPGRSREEAWFVVPGAAGLEIEHDGRTVRTVTPVSPLGQALLGLEAGDEGAVRTPRGPRGFEVLTIV